jgi:hypothetical protein
MFGFCLLVHYFFFTFSSRGAADFLHTHDGRVGVLRLDGMNGVSPAEIFWVE